MSLISLSTMQPVKQINPAWLVVGAKVRYSGDMANPSVEDYNQGLAMNRSPIEDATYRDDWNSLISRYCSDMAE